MLEMAACYEKNGTGTEARIYGEILMSYRTFYNCFKVVIFPSATNDTLYTFVLLKLKEFLDVSIA